jgi:hypothetical protein
MLDHFFHGGGPWRRRQGPLSRWGRWASVGYPRCRAEEGKQANEYPRTTSRSGRETATRALGRVAALLHLDPASFHEIDMTPVVYHPRSTGHGEMTPSTHGWQPARFLGRTVPARGGDLGRCRWTADHGTRGGRHEACRRPARRVHAAGPGLSNVKLEFLAETTDIHKEGGKGINAIIRRA